MLYLFTDLDRTLLPNGNQPESPAARELFAALVAQPNVILTYVSGRSRGLVQNAIDEFSIPEPDYVVGDVGTIIYQVGPDGWNLMDDWSSHIARDWPENTNNIAAKLNDIDHLSLQEPEKQSPHKLSYYTDYTLITRTAKLVEKRLVEMGVSASTISSYDETIDVGFIDILPSNATKLDAVRFLMGHFNAENNQVVYCGDSGNDMPVLISDIQSVLVANSEECVKTQAGKGALSNDCLKTLYIAKGKWGLNGNYSAGIIEGVANFQQEICEWVDRYSQFPLK